MERAYSELVMQLIVAMRDNPPHPGEATARMEELRRAFEGYYKSSRICRQDERAELPIQGNPMRPSLGRPTQAEVVAKEASMLENTGSTNSMTSTPGLPESSRTPTTPSRSFREQASGVTPTLVIIAPGQRVMSKPQPSMDQDQAAASANTMKEANPRERAVSAGMMDQGGMTTAHV